MICILCIYQLIDAFDRERREHRVFEHLLESYPGLLERLQNGSEEELIHVGELVRVFVLFLCAEFMLTLCRSVREPQVQGATT
jgi:hypothetical protein